jgi:prephenate dehydrogenase
VKSLLVVGSGLLGTSAALAARRAGWLVWIEDRDPQAQALAVDLSGAAAGPPSEDPDLCLVCVPPDATGGVLAARSYLHLNTTVSDVASIKTKPLREAEILGADPARLVGGHPMAGREIGGARGARADLFEGRPWVLTPGAAERSRVDLVRELALACGALPVEMGARAHDEAVALVSHAPQVVASLAAARLAGAPDGSIRLAGQGLRDVTRIAASDPGLWTQILAANSPALRAVLADLRDDLDSVLTALDTLAEEPAAEPGSGPDQPDRIPAARGGAEARAVVADLLERGRTGRGRIPGKHGAPAQPYAVVSVVVDDRPGELARIFNEAGALGVNIEDLSIEHSPGQDVGLVELAVAPAAAEALRADLRARGWRVHE